MNQLPNRDNRSSVGRHLKPSHLPTATRWHALSLRRTWSATTSFPSVIACHPCRRGFTLVELIVSGILLGTVMSLTVPTLGWLIKERRAAERRQEAIAEVANIMERITAQPWEQVTPERVRQITLSDETQRQLPNAELKVDVVSKPSAPDVTQIRLELRWKGRSGRLVAPVRLTAWMYRRGRIQ